MGIPELLAPAGSFEALTAAVENGADAIYLGGKVFSARASANNFDMEEMAAALNYAHLRGVRIYVTVNIVIDNGELQEVLRYIRKLYDLGVDGIIVQDLGLAWAVHSLFPSLKLHASTQMTVTNGDGVKLLTGMGFHRVVLAREVSLAEIRSIREDEDTELEVFGHGALCISYSGQCLMSSLIGGRSGNRGRCAQPCRLPYHLVDDKGQALTVEETGLHLLSPRDLNTLAILPDFAAAGISSLKIEGRMKRPEYVATVVRIYRTALDRLKTDPDGFAATPEEEKELAQIFNRDFTTGYLMDQPGGDLMSYKRPNNRGIRLGRVESVQGAHLYVKLDDSLSVGDGVEIWVTKGGRQGFTITDIIQDGRDVEWAPAGATVDINFTGVPYPGDRIFKTFDSRLMGKATASYRDPSRFVPLSMTINAREGGPFTLTGWDDQGNRFTYRSEFIVPKALKHPATEESTAKQLFRLGGTVFQPAVLTYDVEDGVMLPASELNAARRILVEKIEAMRLAPYHHPAVTADIKEILKSLTMPPKKAKALKVSVRAGSFAAAKGALHAGADVIYIGGEVFADASPWTAAEIEEMVSLAGRKGSRVYFAMPRLYHQGERAEVLSSLEMALRSGVSGILAGNLGGLQLIHDHFPETEIISDFGLNVFNSLSVGVLEREGARRVTLSPELTFPQLESFPTPKAELEAIVHGAVPMMVSAYCAPGALCGGRTAAVPCRRSCHKGTFGLKDRMDYVFPLEQDQFCRMHLFNPKDLCLIEHIHRFPAAGVGVIRIEGVRYNQEALSRITGAYCQVRDAIESGNKGGLDDGELRNIQSGLEQYSPAGFTKGHYFRGILE